MTGKKQVLFVCYGLGIGGIEKCMVNLLNVLPEDEFDIDVLTMSPDSAMKPYIRRNVHFYDEFQYIIYSGGAMDAIRSRGGVLRNPGKMLKLLAFRPLDQKGGNGYKIFRKLPKAYDIAIAYSQNGYPLYYVIDKVKAKKKVLWYHNGAYEASEEEQKKHRKYYPSFDSIVAVSEDAAKILREKLPYVRDKILVLKNFCDVTHIRESAKSFQPESFDKKRIHIVTVGRMTREKGALLALEACHLLRNRGKDICWHWVGDGDQSEEIGQKIKQAGLESNFVMEGNQSNPYPYMAAADIYVQPSFYEAYSTTVTEAKVLSKPMVVTDVGGMRDQLTEGENALIVPLDAEKIAAAVEMLIENTDLRMKFEKSLEDCGFDTKAVLEDYKRTVLA